MNIYKGVGLFASGVLFGSAGFKLLSSKDAKKAYTHATAAALRVSRCFDCHASAPFGAADTAS